MNRIDVRLLRALAVSLAVMSYAWGESPAPLAENRRLAEGVAMRADLVERPVGVEDHPQQNHQGQGDEGATGR